MGKYKEYIMPSRDFRGEGHRMSTGVALYTILDLDIDRGCNSCVSPGSRHSLCDRSDPDIPLFSYKELPLFLRGNPYVTNGYRVFLSPAMCIKSLFVWSNETINIWSHLLGFIFFTLFLAYDDIVYLPSLPAKLSDYIIVSIALLCYQYCMLCSAGYHLFSCHSEKAARRWLAVDLSGISIGLLGCYFPSIYYAFYCNRTERDIFMLCVIVLSLVVLALQFNKNYFSPSWARKRTVLYVALVLFGIIPTIRWGIAMTHYTGFFEEFVIFMPKVITMYTLGAVALAIYLTKVPEKCCPGKVDFIGSSHQLWHIIVVIAFVYWHNCCLELLKYRHAELRTDGECT